MTRRGSLACRASQAPLPACLLIVASSAMSGVLADELPHYRMSLALEPERQHLHANVELRLPAARFGETIEFTLNSELVIFASEPAVQPLDDDVANTPARDAAHLRAATRRYAVTLPEGSGLISLHYAGVVDSAPAVLPGEALRGFAATPGLISPRGVYLAGSTAWYPQLDDTLLTFSLTSNVPEGWHLVSAGSGISSDGAGFAHWHADSPVNQVHLVGGPLQRYAGEAGAIETLVYLRSDEPQLAMRYLDAAARYLKLYQGLIGPYPYDKFAVVENFWETGYGMPSFTLLGPRILRFPFILASSFPHEILHNWWGGGVFVDPRSGNWSEGLTTYLADHLMRELEGQGAAYRRDTLRRYRDLVAEGQDFPLAEFRRRYSPGNEAVGYGKAMMGFHMLRQRVGDEEFRQTLARFWELHRGRQAGFGELRDAFEYVSGEDLERFFDEWTGRPGAAQLVLEDVRSVESGAGWAVRGSIRQMQPGALELDVPVVVATRTGPVRRTVRSDAADARFLIETASEPIGVALDPAFDLFRLLDPRETAPSLGQLFGARQVMAILPDDEAGRAEDWQALVAAWQAGAASPVEVVSASGLEALPEDRAVWLLGADNPLAAKLFDNGSIPGLEIDTHAFNIGGSSFSRSSHALVLALRHPADPALAVAWISASPGTDLDGLARRLPHFSRYSWLAFADQDGSLAGQGEWPVTDSPLNVALDAAAAPAPQTEAREPLAQLPAIFSRDRMMREVEWLADPAREGRGVGTRGLRDSAYYISEAFAAAGLRPGGPDGEWFQRFMMPSGPDGRPQVVKNVIGYLPGTNDAFAGEAVVVSAHYDHLGMGWPNVRADAQGQLHPGADDNASGVAVLLELARSFGSGPGPQRGLLFIAFTAEEAGLIGSRHFVRNPTPWPIENIIGVINLDTVGRLGDQPLSILAADSAREWPFVFRGISFMTGIETRIIGGAAESSDQQAFIEVGIPGVQLFTAAHEDYHRPSDTADRIDADGLVRVATVAKEAVNYLATTLQPPTPAAPAGAAPAEPAARRRVSLGTVPDFGFGGPGMRVEDVVPRSPAASAGLAAGDIVVRMDGQEVEGLGGFNQLLGGLEPGQTIAVEWLRDGVAMQAEVKLVER